MGAVSGDINTLSFSVANAADLTSRPTAALRSGDRAYVTDKVATTEGPLFFIDKSSVIPVDGVGVLATNSGVGRWLSEALYGAVPDPGLPSFDNIAQLAAYDDTDIPADAEVWVRSVRAYFQKRVEADPGTDDNITNFRNAGNTATWYRSGAPNGYWAYTWSANGQVHVDSVNGNDENTGLTAGTALRSVNELSRRIASAQVTDFLFMSIRVGVGGLAQYASGSQTIIQTLAVPDWCYVEFIGTLTETVASSTVAARQVRDMATVPQTAAERQTATMVAGAFWQPELLYLNISQGNAPGWALSGLDSGAFGAAGADTFFENDPAIGNSIAGYTLPTVDGLQIFTAAYAVSFRWLHFSNDVYITYSPNPAFRQCRFDAAASILAYLAESLTIEYSRFEGALGPPGLPRIMAATTAVSLNWCVIEGTFHPLCQTIRATNCSLNGANVVVGNATFTIRGQDGVCCRQANFRNIEMRDNAFIVAGAGDNNGAATPGAIDLYFEGNFTSGDIGYLYGRNDNVNAQPLQLLNAGIRAWYNTTNNAGGAPVAPAATQFSMTSVFATNWLRVAATGVWAALPSIGVAATEFMSAIAPYES